MVKESATVPLEQMYVHVNCVEVTSRMAVPSVMRPFRPDTLKGTMAGCLYP